MEGNVGAGKSSLIEVLKSRHKDWNFIAEPVDVWSSIKSDNGESLLEVYYKDRKRWSYSFQSYALLSRFQNTQNAMALATQSGQGAAKSLEKGGDDIKTIFVTERCIETDYHVFVKMLRDQGAMDRLELE